jgi:glutathione synthase/RimK-type ligase-like ATP-grasp enzyme
MVPDLSEPARFRGPSEQVSHGDGPLRPGLEPMPDCLIATCGQLPDLDPDDRLLAGAMSDLGMNVAAADWRDPNVDWSSAPICLVRSTWDYHKRPESFARWVAATSRSTMLLNPANVITWNCHKFYLSELSRAGVPTVPTVCLDRRTPVRLEDVMTREGWSEAVIKPAYGASADGVLRVGTHRGERAAAQTHLEELLAVQDVLLQPYIEAIAVYHERALVFIDGEYSHAVTKTPFMHARADLALRAHHPPGFSGEAPVVPTREEIAVARRALDAAPQGHVYARVDLVRDGDASLVIEVELIEPTLYLFAEETAARKLADAIRRRAAEGRKSLRTA